MVVPVGVPIRLQTTGADVIHSFAVPSLWFKLDAVPGRINERSCSVEEPGIYYGQCSELCGARHGYMPIAVEAVPMDEVQAPGSARRAARSRASAPAAAEPRRAAAGSPRCRGRRRSGAPAPDADRAADAPGQPAHRRLSEHTRYE